MKRCVTICAMLLSCLTQVGYADTETVNGITWTYTVSNGEASVGGGTASSTAVPTSTTGTITIPAELGGYPVTSIGRYAFEDCRGITLVMIPESITSIGQYAFKGCSDALFEVDNVYHSMRIIDGWIVDVRSGNATVTYNNGQVLENIYTTFISGDVTLPNGIKGIADAAFSQSLDLRSIVFPDTTKFIGIGAFYGSQNLTNVVLGANVKGIGVDAFDWCRSLHTLILPDSVKEVGGFYDGWGGISCYGNLYFLGNAPNLDDWTEKHGNGLLCLEPDALKLFVKRDSTGWDVAIPGIWKGCQIDYMDEYMVTFDSCDTVQYKTIYKAGESAKLGELPKMNEVGYQFLGWFTDRDGGSEVDSDTIVVHDMTVYAHWKQLYIVTFDANGGDGGAIMTQDYGTAIIPPTVTRTGYAFKGWSPEVAQTVPAENVTYTAQWEINHYTVTFDANGGEGGGAVTRDYGTSLAAPVVTRKDYDFAGWFSEVSGGERISEEDYVVTHDATLYAHWKLKSGAWRYSLEDGKATVLEYGSPSGDIVIPAEIDGYPVTAIGANLFKDCVDVRSVAIPESVISIGQEAFAGCSGLTELVLPSGLKTIGYMSFYGCSGIASLTIPDSITSIGFDAFSGCTFKSLVVPQYICSRKLDSIVSVSSLTNVMVSTSVKNIGSSAFSDCYELLRVTIPASVTNIGASAFEDCSRLASVTIPDSVMHIGASAFESCHAMKSLVLSTNIVDIHSRTFANCRGLKQLIVPDSVRNIGEHAFDFAGMESVVIGNGVTNIGDYAFYDCTLLSRLIIGENVQSIGAYSFADIHSLSKVVIPDSVITIGDHAFERIVSLSEVVVGRGVRYIGDGAFYGSEAMEYIGRIIFNGDAPQLGANVFSKASSNCRIYVRYGSSGWGVDIPGRWGVGVSDPAEVADISGSGWYSYKVPASDGEFVFVFTNAGRTVSFTPNTDVSVKEVFVLGGGGGGGPGGGGGGGGESLWITNAVDYAASETGISVYVGRGGSGGDVRYSSNGVRASASHNGSTSWVQMKNPLNTATTDQYQGYGGLRGGYFYRDNDSYSAGYGSYWGGSAGGGSALVTSGHHAGDSVMNAAGRTYGRADYASGFGGAAVDGAPGGGGGGGLRGIATGGGNYADEGARRSVVYAGSDGADGTGGISGGKGGGGFPISIMGDSPIRFAIGNLVGDQDAWLGGGGGGGSGRNRFGYSEMWGIGAGSPGEGGRGGGGSGGLYTAGTFYNYQPGLGKNGAPFTGGGGGGGSFMEPVTNASSAASNWILGGGKGADGFVVMLVKVKSGGGNGWPIDYVHHDVTLDANGGVCSVCSVNVADGPLSEVLPIPTREDAAFLGWFTELEGGEEVDSSTIVLGETTFYAHWLFEVADPQIVSEGGTEFYADSCAVTITCATPGASIYYADDGTTPKINELYLYSEPITITDTTTFKAVAVLDGIKSAYATLTITKKALTLQDALDASDGVSVDTESTFPWKPVLDPEAKTGDSSARSAQIGNRESSWLSATVSGTGKLSFWCKTSCEHDEDDKYSWDRLMVYTNDVEIVDWRMDSETDWAQRTVKFDGGVNTVKWVYFKDRTGADGEDCAWVDSIAWQPLTPDATVEIGGGKSLVVPGEWLSEHQEYLRAKASDVDVALKSTSANGRLSVVECYLLGLDPEKTDEDFKITSFPMKADGSPDLEAITFSPPQSKWNISGATPKLKGKANLSDQWQDVPPGGDQSFGFFTIVVELP